VAGERRFRASKLLGKETIPAIIESDEDISNILSKQLVENLQRQDLNPLERAFAIGRMRDRLKLSFRDIATKLGVSKAVVQRSLEILTLPEDLQAALAEGASESKIFVLKEIADPAARRPLIERLEQLTREALQGEVERWRGDKVYHGGTLKAKPQKHGDELSTDDRRVVEEIQRSLGTKVQLQRSKSKPERGKLVIEFYNKDDFAEICERLRRTRS
jgi:ParB family chromosome partitioning protein